MAPSRVLDSTPVDFTYGTLFGGLDLCPVAWPNATQLFSCDPLNTRKAAPGRTLGAQDYANFHRVNWHKVLRQGTPDLLVVCQPAEEELRHAWIGDLPSRGPQARGPADRGHLRMADEQ